MCCGAAHVAWQVMSAMADREKKQHKNAMSFEKKRNVFETTSKSFGGGRGRHGNRRLRPAGIVHNDSTRLKNMRMNAP